MRQGRFSNFCIGIVARLALLSVVPWFTPVHAADDAFTPPERSKVRITSVGVINLRQVADSAEPRETSPRRGIETPGRTPLSDPHARALRRDGQRRPRAVARGGPLPASPAPACDFVALRDNRTVIPPDTHGAVGREHLVVFLNSEVRVMERDGRWSVTITLDDFWAPLGFSDVFDPRVFYDVHTDRFIAVSVAQRRSAESSVIVAVSLTADPAGEWMRWHIDADPDDLTWADFPTLGFNDRWVVIQANMFTNEEDSDFDGVRVFALEKQPLFGIGTVRGTRFYSSVLGGTISPAVTLDPDEPDVYLFQARTNGARIYRITGEPGDEQFETVTSVLSEDPWDYSPGGDFAPQSGSDQRIQVNGTRMHNVVYRDGHLWSAHTIFLPVGGVERSSIQWWQVETDGTVIQRGRIDDPDGVYFYAFPSIAVNSRGDALVGYARFAATEYASGAYSLRLAADPPGTMREEVLLKEGEAPYFKSYRDRNRWGDYSMTVVDPANDLDFWTIQEYAETPAPAEDRWGTWWGHVSVSTNSDANGDGVADLCESGVGWVDADSSGRVDGFDLGILARAFATRRGDQDFATHVDLNRDGWVDGLDLDRLAQVFGDRVP